MTKKHHHPAKDPVPAQIVTKHDDNDHHHHHLEGDIEGHIGRKLKLHCEVVGEPFPVITVEKLNAPFEDDFNIEYNGERLRLLVRHVETADAGQYRITAQNETGFDQKDFNIIIKETPHAPQNARVTGIDEDGSIVLGWDPPLHDGGYPVERYTILFRKDKNGPFKALKKKVEDTVYKMPVVKLPFAQTLHYKICADNKLGSGKESAEVELIAKRARGHNITAKVEWGAAQFGSDVVHANMTKLVQPQTVHLHEDAHFSCHVIGQPEPKVIWIKVQYQRFKGNHMVKCLEGRKFHMSFEDGVSTLTVKDCDMKDDGSYMCLAQNIAGKFTSDAKLTVVDPETEKHKYNKKEYILEQPEQHRNIRTIKHEGGKRVSIITEPIILH